MCDRAKVEYAEKASKNVSVYPTTNEIRYYLVFNDKLSKFNS